ncbi:MAG: pyruvate kinase [Lewinellaceae bacterium]|nr:pyruvate kinase [Lewinellaceae bacterium]
MSNTLSSLHADLERIRQHVCDIEQHLAPVVEGVHSRQRLSASNLLHYLALRCEDLRDLQDALHEAGLSSLASSESHVLRQIESALQRLGADIPESERSICDYPVASQLIHQRAVTLFGPKVNPHIPHLMVTFDSGMADDYAKVKALVQAGMNVARINCAHDNVDIWKRMVTNIRKASRATGHSCKIYLDLAGPKIRTVLLGKGRNKGRLKLKPQEQFLLAEAQANFDKTDKVVGCTLPGIVKDLQVGDRVLFDDGLYEAVVEKTNGMVAQIRLIRASSDKPRIKPEKGINFPDTEISVRSLTEFDKSVIPFARANADLVGFSFVRQPEDVAELQNLMRLENGDTLPLVLKIETFEAVQNLPALLLQGMQAPVFGVMIARGDLAVEIGFERLSEIQEEILWICEAAHVPVIWATQVLESQNKSGIATRSEVTDAARAAHAECVMLNKGKYLLDVLASLRDILHRSGGHHLKKRYVFRPLAIAEHFLKTNRHQQGDKKTKINLSVSRRRSPRKSGTR